MSGITQEDVELFDYEGIDDFCLASVEQDYSFNSTPAMGDNNNYNYSEYNLMLRSDENQPLTFLGNYQPSSTTVLPSSDLLSAADSFSSASTVDSLSSDLTAAVVLPISNAPSAVSLPVKQRLNGMIKKKMTTEGRLDTSLTSSAKDSSYDQLTPEEEKKKLEKQHRNKESARKSRQKKKEDEEKLFKDNRRLTDENQELRNSVDNLKISNHKWEEFLANHHHQCLMSPQQDNGDKMCVQTGSSKVCVDDADSSDAENKLVVTAFELMNFFEAPLPYSHGSESERKQAILCELEYDGPSEMVTSGTAYTPERGVTASYNFGIQESVVPNISNNVIYYNKLETGNGAIGGKLVAGSSVGSDTQIFNAESVPTHQSMYHAARFPLSSEVTQANNLSVSMMKPSEQIINPWSTDGGHESAVDEDLKFFHNISPPPVKKFKKQ